MLLKVITIYNKDTDTMEEVLLEELQVFKVFLAAKCEHEVDFVSRQILHFTAYISRSIIAAIRGRILKTLIADLPPFHHQRGTSIEQSACCERS